MGRMPDWFHDDDLWRAAYEFLFSDERRSAAAGEVDSILKLANGSRVVDVLDLCCGPGRHSVALARRGFHVTGVDGSAFLLDRAMEYARQSEAAVEWVRADMREFSRPDSFDLAVNLFTSFGYFDAAEENQRVLNNCFASLHRGGTLVIDVMGREVLARIFQPTHMQALPNGRMLIQHVQIHGGWTRAETDWLFVRGDSVEHRFTVRHWVYAGTDLASMLRSSGFSSVQLYGGFDGSEYGPQANRLLAFARKP